MSTPIKHRNQELLKKIGANIRHYRQLLGLSQTELANLCDVELSTINRIELGKSSPTISMLFVVAEQLQVQPEELIKFDN